MNTKDETDETEEQQVSNTKVVTDLPSSCTISRIKSLFANSSVPMVEDNLHPLTIIQRSSRGSTETNLESISTLNDFNNEITNTSSIDISSLPITISRVSPLTQYNIEGEYNIEGASISTMLFEYNDGEKIVEEMQKHQLQSSIDIEPVTTPITEVCKIKERGWVRYICLNCI
jgi:hypothetical protein